MIFRLIDGAVERELFQVIDFGDDWLGLLVIDVTGATRCEPAAHSGATVSTNRVLVLATGPVHLVENRRPLGIPATR